MNKLLKGHTVVSAEELKNLTIKGGALYWKNKVLKSKTSLTWPQLIWATLFSIITLLASLAVTADGLMSLNKEFCVIETSSCQFKKDENTQHTNSKE